MLNKRGVVLSIDIVLASLLLVYFLTSFSKISHNFDFNRKVINDEARNIVVVLEDELKTMNLTLINDTINELKKEDYDYSLNITYYDKNLNTISSTTLGTSFNDLSNDFSVYNSKGVIIDRGNITTYYFVQLRLWRKNNE